MRQGSPHCLLFPDNCKSGTRHMNKIEPTTFDLERLNIAGRKVGPRRKGALNGLLVIRVARAGLRSSP